MKYPNCIFCGRDAYEPTKEDVFPKWIAREWPNDLFALDVNTSEDDTMRRVLKAKGHFGLVTYGPCQRCNNGWMSDLENAVKPILRPMMKGAPTALKRRDQVILTRWTVKTAMTHDQRLCTAEGQQRYFTTAERYAMFKTQSVPPFAFLHAAHYIGSRNLTAQATHLTMRFGAETPNAPAFFFAVSVGQVALCLLMVRPSKEAASATLRLPVKSEFLKATIPCSPPSDVQHWPPELVKFNDESMSDAQWAFRVDKKPPRR